MLSGSRSLFQIIDRTTSREICERAELAETFLSRLVGLLGRPSLASDSGLWIRPSSGIHTFGMVFSIDVVVLDKAMQVVRLAQSVRPWRVANAGPRGHSVLELPEGTIQTSGLVLGDCLSAKSLDLD